MFEEIKSDEQIILEKFLSMSVKSSDEVFDAFSSLNGAKQYGVQPLKRFVYIPGSREDRVLLVAHADTVWDKNWNSDNNDVPQKLRFKYGVYSNGEKNSFSGIGADDRAGCAILYLLKNSGHSLLIVDGEEHGQIGSNFLKKEFPEIFQEINSHQYAIQFDRCNEKDFKCYNIPVTKEFKRFLQKNLGFFDAGSKSITDIAVLCEKICAANLSVGYYNEHTLHEILVYKEWLKTYKKISKLLKEKQNKFGTKIVNKESCEMTL